MTSMAGHGVAGLGASGLGTAPLSRLDAVRHGRVRLDSASPGLTRHGAAPLFGAWCVLARQVTAWLGESWQGWAPLVAARCDVAGRVQASPVWVRPGTACLGFPGLGEAFLNASGRDAAGPVSAGFGEARQVTASLLVARLVGHGEFGLGIASLSAVRHDSAWNGKAGHGRSGPGLAPLEASA